MSRRPEEERCATFQLEEICCCPSIRSVPSLSTPFAHISSCAELQLPRLLQRWLLQSDPSANPTLRWKPPARDSTRSAHTRPPPVHSSTQQGSSHFRSSARPLVTCDEHLNGGGNGGGASGAICMAALESFYRWRPIAGRFLACHLSARAGSRLASARWIHIRCSGLAASARVSIETLCVPMSEGR